MVTASLVTGFGDSGVLMQRQALLVVALIWGLGAIASPPYPINDPTYPRVSGENSMATDPLPVQGGSSPLTRGKLVT